MKATTPYPIRLDVSCLPDNIYVSYESYKTHLTSVDLDILQNQSGRNLIKDMAGLFWDEDEIQIITQKNEKPRAFCEAKEASISFSHTKNAVAGAISLAYNVGCDMENVNRTVHPRLMDRIKNSEERADLYEKIEPVRIWTLKESALKMIGTGLRKPMKSIKIFMVKTGEFDVEIDDGTQAKICSFQHKNHWISVCYQKLSDN